MTGAVQQRDDLNILTLGIVNDLRHFICGDISILAQSLGKIHGLAVIDLNFLVLGLRLRLAAPGGLGSLGSIRLASALFGLGGVRSLRQSGFRHTSVASRSRVRLRRLRLLGFHFHQDGLIAAHFDLHLIFRQREPEALIIREVQLQFRISQSRNLVDECLDPLGAEVLPAHVQVDDTVKSTFRGRAGRSSS
nr:hypothetical protein [uncultured Pseudoflavonifractor sp.]